MAIPTLMKRQCIQISASFIQNNAVETTEWLRKRTENLDIFLFSAHDSMVLFPMFCLLVERQCQILVF